MKVITRRFAEQCSMTINTKNRQVTPDILRDNQLIPKVKLATVDIISLMPYVSVTHLICPKIRILELKKMLEQTILLKLIF